MPGLSIYMDQNLIAGDIGPQTFDLIKLANSVTAWAGDPMVLTTATGSEERLRLLTSSDIAALYQVSSVDAGIYGIMKADVATNSSGAHTAPAYPVAVAQQPHYAVLSLDYLNTPDPVTGRARANVFATSNIIGGYLWGTTTATAALIGVNVGLKLSTIGGTGYWFWDSAATTKIGEIYKVAEDDPYFNKTVTAQVADTTHYPRCLLGVRLFVNYQQGLTGVDYTS